MSQKEEQNTPQNSDQGNIPPRPVQAGVNQPIQEISKSEGQATTASDNDKKAEETQRVDTCACAVKRSQKKYMSLNDIFTCIIAIGSIAAFAISIYTLQETQKEFAIQHTPYLSIGGVGGPSRLDSTQHWIAITYDIHNIGDQPAHIYQFYARFKFDTPSVSTILDTMQTIKYDLWSVFVPVQKPIDMSISITHDLNPEQISKLKAGDCTLYADFAYINYITHKWRSYKFIVRLAAKPEQGNCLTAVLYNENKDTVLPFPVPN